MVMVYLQSLRTQVIFWNTSGNFTDISAYSSLVIGNFYNCILPGNLGGGVRAWHFSRFNNTSFSATIAVLVVEKVIDAFLLIPLLLFFFFYLPFVGHFVQYIFLFTLSFIICFALILFSVIRFKKINRFLFYLTPTKSLRRFLFKIYIESKNHSHRLFKQKTIFLSVLLSYCMFFSNVLQYYWVMKAVNIDAPILSFITAYCLSLSMVLVAFFPSAPSSLGVTHYGVYATLLFVAQINPIKITVNLLQLFAVTGICLHLTYFIPEVITGVFFLIKERKILF
jgi:uncharacterized protein (TIRG00374 family)